MKTRRLRDISLRGWLSIMRWTVLGTLGCMGVSVIFNWIAFYNFGAEARHLSIVSAVAINSVLAGPLFFYLTIKLRELAAANHALNVLATTDALTGILNRSAFVAAVEDRLQHRRPSFEPERGAFLVIDADKFKSINDRYGHARGDEALRAITAATLSSLRAGDIVGRLGGEEFGVFLPEVTKEQAEQICERLRRAVARISFEPAAGMHHPLSVSIGCAVFDRAPRYDELFRCADALLYEAKRHGRDRTVCADIPPLCDVAAPLSEPYEDLGGAPAGQRVGTGVSPR